MRATSRWSIGIYAGESALHLAPARGAVNPILSASDITDVEAAFVADPFMIRVGAAWHMFFEVMPASSRVGAVGHATSPDGLRWRYDGLVLREPFHVSYPCVFESGGEWFLVPESHHAGAVRLYHAERFPSHWSPVATLLDGEWADPTVFRRNRQWWLMAASPARRATALHLFRADDPRGPWREHPDSPVVRDDPATARPAGRVVEHEGRLLRFAQDCSERYGRRVSAFEILELTPDRYRERAVPDGPVLGPSRHGWNAARMHHVDAHEIGPGCWLAAVDGDAGQ
jgi:hypothetical protein